MDSSNNNIIPGIHNYCDRWCERCTHTKHCSVFQMEEEAGMMDSNMDSDLDITNQEFWDHLSKVFKDTIKMISEQAEDMGIDLENLEIEKIEVLKHKKGDLEKLSDHYSTRIRDWFQSFYTDSNEEIEFPTFIPENEKAKIQESIDVIQWYMLFITVKMQRAFASLTMLTEIDKEADYQMTDHLGSAKITIIAIERSLKALSHLYAKIPDIQHQLIDFLVILSQLKSGMMEAFPEAMDFARPGLDD